MAKTQLNVRVDETTAEAARRQAGRRGMSVNRYIEELVKQDVGEVGKTFVESAADFMKQYESVFTEEFGADTSATATATDTATATSANANANATERGGEHSPGREDAR